MTQSSGTDAVRADHRVRARAHVSGLVQGVGFRPFVWREATSRGLTGWVGNDAAGVVLEVEGAPESVEALLAALTRPPPLARVDDVRSESRPVSGAAGFEVRSSATEGARRALVSPDTATCDDCLRELHDPADRRYGYPFVNCTIVRSPLHDRAVRALRPVTHDHGRLRALPGLPGRVRRPRRPPVPRRAGVLSGLRPAAPAARPVRTRGRRRADRGHRRAARRGRGRGGQGDGRLPPRGRRPPGGRGGQAARPQAPGGPPVRPHGRRRGRGARALRGRPRGARAADQRGPADRHPGAPPRHGGRCDDPRGALGGTRLAVPGSDAALHADAHPADGGVARAARPDQRKRVRRADRLRRRRRGRPTRRHRRRLPRARPGHPHPGRRLGVQGRAGPRAAGAPLARLRAQPDRHAAGVCRSPSWPAARP